MPGIDSILRAYDNATAEESARGRVWYPDYRDRTLRHAAETGTPEHRALGIVAVSSINTRPEPGLAWSRKVMQGETGGHLPLACERAAQILASAETFEEARDIATPYAPTGPRKVRSFACNVRTGGETCEHPEPCVTIDRWAIYIWSDGAEKSVPKGRKYDRIAADYRAAAEARGVTPATMQAVTWVTVAE